MKINALLILKHKLQDRLDNWQDTWTMTTLIQQVLCPKLFSSNRKQHIRRSGQQWTTVVSPDVSLRIIFMIKCFMKYSLWICFLLSYPDKHRRLSHFSKLFHEQATFLIKDFFSDRPFSHGSNFSSDITLRVRGSNDQTAAFPVARHTNERDPTNHYHFSAWSETERAMDSANPEGHQALKVKQHIW